MILKYIMIPTIYNAEIFHSLRPALFFFFVSCLYWSVAVNSSGFSSYFGQFGTSYPAGNYMCQWHRSGVFIVSFEDISHLVLVFLLLTLNRYIPAR